MLARALQKQLARDAGIALTTAMETADLGIDCAGGRARARGKFAKRIMKSKGQAARIKKLVFTKGVFVWARGREFG